MGGKASTPDAPDYFGLAEQQGQQNQWTSLFNSVLANPNLSTPYGSFSYSLGTPDWYGTGTGPGGTPPDGGSGGSSGGDGGAGKFQDGSSYEGPGGIYLPKPTATFTLSPEQQALFDKNQSNSQGLLDLQGDAVGRYNDIMNMSPDASRQRVEDAMYGKQTRYLTPQIEQRQQALDSQLANEGVFRGAEIFGNEQNRFADQRDEAYADARDRAILLGGQEESRIQNQANANLALPFQMYKYMYPFQGVGANAGAAAAPPDIYGAGQNAYSAALNAANANNAASSNMWGDLFGTAASLGSAYLMSGSDARRKRDFRHVATLPNGVKWYSFNWRDGTPGCGVKAQEVAMIVPSAVVEGPDGYLLVDYSRIGG